MEFAGKEVHVVALRDINIGEEITISYIDESEDVRKRKGSLEERWFFKCACERCEQEETEARGIRG